MIISRLPKSRASSDNAPGPRKTMAAATATISIADGLTSKRFVLQGGSNESPAQAIPSAASALATGVKSPISNVAPTARKTVPITHVPGAALTRLVKYDVPSAIVVTPIAARNKSRPMPGHPPGNVENSRCSPCLLGVRRHFFERLLIPRVAPAPGTRNP